MENRFTYKKRCVTLPTKVIYVGFPNSNHPSINKCLSKLLKITTEIIWQINNGNGWFDYMQYENSKSTWIPTKQ